MDGRLLHPELSSEKKIKKLSPAGASMAPGSLGNNRKRGAGGRTGPPRKWAACPSSPRAPTRPTLPPRLEALGGGAEGEPTNAPGSPRQMLGPIAGFGLID